MRSNRWSHLTPRATAFALALCIVSVLGVLLAGCGASSGAGSASPLLAARVNDQPISLDLYQHYLAYRKANVAVQDLQSGQQTATDWQSPAGRAQLATLEKQTLSDLIDGAILHQEMAQLHLKPSAAEVATDTKQFNDYIASLKKTAHPSPEVKALLAALTPDFTQFAITEQEDAKTLPLHVQVPAAHLRVIVLDSATKARDIQTRAENGADFAALAKANSQSTQAASTGGDLGIRYLGDLPAQFDSALFQAPHVGKYVTVTASGKYYLFQVTEQGNKSLSDIKDAQRQQNIFISWFTTALRGKAKIQSYVVPISVVTPAASVPSNPSGLGG